MEIKLPDPWERKQSETATAFAAFTQYLNLQRGSRSIDSAYRSAKGRVGDAKCRANRHWRTWAHKYEWEDRALAWDAWLDREAAIINVDAIAEARMQSAGVAALVQSYVTFEIQSFPALNPEDPKYHSMVAALTMEERSTRALVLHRLTSAYRTATATRLFAFGAPRVKETQVQSGVVQVMVQWEDEESVDWESVADGNVNSDPPAN